MITAYTIHQYDEVMALPDPKHVWIDGNVIRVYTGKDIPPPPPPAVEYVEKAAAIKALRTAGVKDDTTADAALKTAAASSPSPS